VTAARIVKGASTVLKHNPGSRQIEGAHPGVGYRIIELVE
jgi:hypothetical protein